MEGGRNGGMKKGREGRKEGGSERDSEKKRGGGQAECCEVRVDGLGCKKVSISRASKSYLFLVGSESRLSRSG